LNAKTKLYKTLPWALFFSPITIVAFSVFILLLPLSGVFAPGSLTVATQNFTDIGNCTISTGNLSTLLLVPGYLYKQENYLEWAGVKPRATALTTQRLANQRIPDLPQACGSDCRYNVSVPSFVFQCTPNPTSLPYGQAGSCPDPPDCGPDLALWNGTMDPTSRWAFYVASASNKWNGTDWSGGTSGNAHCSPVQTQYDVEVRTIALTT